MGKIQWVNTALSTCLIFFLTACAVIGPPPAGGPEDTSPPEILRMSPENKQTNFNAKKIELYFDEYIVQNFSAKDFIITPSTEVPPTLTVTGKKAIIDLSRVNLAPNTTYSIITGASINDNNNGNTAPSIQYVFSTGTVIDSLKIAGQSVDAFSQKSGENIKYLLYDAGENDSVVLRKKPIYFTTGQSGKFTLTYLSPGNYKLLALEDKNNNLLLDVGESIGFLDDNIQLEKDTVLDVRLSLFPFSGSGFSIKSLRADAYQLRMKFTAPVDSIVSAGGGRSLFAHYSADRDSVVLFTNPTNRFTLRDSFRFISIRGNTLEIVDTILSIRGEDIPKLEDLKLAASASHTNLRDYGYATLLTFNFPVKNINTGLIRFTGNNQDIKLDNTLLYPLDANYFTWILKANLNPAINYKLAFNPAAATDIYGRKLKDSFIYAFSGYNPKNYASLAGSVSTVDGRAGQFILQLLQEGNKLIYQRIYRDSLEFNIGYLDAGKYTFRIIEDKNRNGRWDGGDLWKREAPENVYYSSGTYDLKQGWQMKDTRLVLPAASKRRGRR